MKSKAVFNVYLFTAVITLGLYLFELWMYHSTLGPPAVSCLFVVFFGFPCAVCGGSHAIKSLLNGQIWTALNFNILTTVIFFFHIIISLILLYDFMFSSDLFIKSYHFILRKLEKKNIRYALALFLIGCWMVNIFKYHSW